MQLQKITPFLWFNGNAEEAANFYVSVFPDSKIGAIARCGDNGPGPKGSVLTIEFVLNGQTFYGLNGGPQFPFTEAVSFAVNCDTQDEIDFYWEKLVAGGGKHVQCGWLQDRFGLRWQVVPSHLGDLLGGDPEKCDRVMQVVMKMVKLDIAAMKRAAA
jgi:predicted 3-demethylubiquinone-9 3-methyltransferase (glyoxalase superfamily)